MTPYHQAASGHQSGPIEITAISSMTGRVRQKQDGRRFERFCPGIVASGAHRITNPPQPPLLSAAPTLATLPFAD